MPKERSRMPGAPARRQALVTGARRLRRESTVAEQRLWEALRNRRLGGWKFLRQRPLHGFILDFYCARAALAVEVDGGIHDRMAEADPQRERMLASRGVSVIRVTNDDVLHRLEETQGRIEEALTTRLRERGAERSMIPSLSLVEGNGR